MLVEREPWSQEIDPELRWVFHPVSDVLAELFVRTGDSPSNYLVDRFELLLDLKLGPVEVTRVCTGLLDWPLLHGPEVESSLFHVRRSA